MHADGHLPMSESFIAHCEPCRNKCFICTGKYKDFVLPIVFDGAMDFMKSSHFKDGLKEDVTYDMREHIPNLIWNSDDWQKSVFGIKSIAKKHVYSFFFQLLATNLIQFQWRENKKRLVCVRSCDERDKMRFLKAKNWRGFEFRSKRHGGAVVTFESILARYKR